MEESVDEYSDDFEADYESPVEASTTPPPASLPRLPGRDGPDVTPEHVLKRKINAKKDSSYTKRKRKGHQFSTPKTKPKAPPTNSSTFSPRDREMSAYKNTIRKLQSKLNEQQKRLEEERKETKLINRLRIMQEKDLDRFQKQEGELPQLLARHAEEVRVVREQLKRSLNSSLSCQKQSDEYREEMLKLRDETKRLRVIASKRNLLGRDELTHQLQLATHLVKEKEEKIVELERKLELEIKNHASEVRSLVQRNKFLSAQVADAHQASERANSKLKEKEKNLDIMNMYTQRFGKVNLSMGETSPAMLSQHSQTQVTCPASKSVLFRISSQTLPSNEIERLESPVPKNVQVKSAQTTLELNPKESDLELKVLNVTHRVIDPQKAKHIAIQTSTETPPSKTTTDVSVQTSEILTAPSTVSPMTQPSKQFTSPNAGVDPMEIEKRKREELLAKLRQIEGIKNPPESKPFESTAAKISTEKRVFSGKKQQQPFQPGESSVTSRTNLPERDPLSTSNYPPSKSPFDTSQSTTLQGNGSQTGIQNLLLGESQPFQTGLMLNASRSNGYQPVNPPETSLAQSPAQTFASSISNSTQPFNVFGPNGVQTKKPQGPVKRSSLFNLAGGQMTKASANLSSLQESVATSQDTKLESSLLMSGEERKATVPVDLSKKFGDSTPSRRQKKEGQVKSVRSPSFGSLLSWPDPVQNMHAGKPAYSTENDPFGRKHVAKQSKDYKPLHGRRAVMQQEVIPDELSSISENHPGSTAHQKNFIKPQSGGQSYPWEVHVHLRDGKEGVESRSSDHSDSLLPFRPKQNNGFGTSAQTSVTEPDDLEQVIL